MKCQRCSGDSRVIETREPKRRRECTSCGHRWTTFELSAAEVGKMRADVVRLARVRGLVNETRP